MPGGYVAHQRHGRARLDRTQVHGQRVRDPLAVRDPAQTVLRRRIGVRTAEQAQCQHDRGLPHQPEPRNRLRRPRAAFERGAHQVGAQAAFDIGARTQTQHVERDELAGVDQRLRALFGQGPGHRRPDRAEDLVAGPHRQRHPGNGHRLVVERIDVHGCMAAMESLEDAVARQAEGEAFRYLAAQDRLHSGLVGLVLAAGEGEHP
ncbi:hypothetical protein ACIQZB_43675 [Streptomyces sp. NPDC097727]|uniref:hypothetical protein n=1 Tax=Streptomyces sp. NPDC097727 TaxID=3366092 RepID=UPI0037F61835